MSNRRTKDRGAWVALGVASVALIAAIVVVSRGPALRNKLQENRQVADGSSEPDELQEGYVRIGGIQRPATDLTPRREQGVAAPSPELQQSLSYGQTPRVNPGANDHTRSVSAALKSGQNPERLSPVFLPKPFDRDAYRKDPGGYLSVVEPGRVYQPAQPGKAVAPLKQISGRFHRVEQGETIPLRVHALPDAPVTFTSFDLGQFENQLSSITVKADRRGVATARFTASAGTIEDVDILAASPVTSGQAEFVVHVSLPRPAGSVSSGD